MEASAGLVAGSHNRNELVVIHGHEEPKALKNLDGQVCEICGDEVGLTVDGDLFVACNECGFPVCRPCYEYERREGGHLCPHCKTRYKRIKGSPRVEGDDDEEDIDDIEHEFKIEDEKNNHKLLAEAMLRGKMSYGRGPEDEDTNVQLPPVITGLRSRPGCLGSEKTNIMKDMREDFSTEVTATTIPILETRRKATEMQSMTKQQLRCLHELAISLNSS